ncbi:MAG: DUF6491 family protein [Xanthomonadales bacterium]|nr:DUF6491 family protein [Xanthomonadales bacterium]
MRLPAAPLVLLALACAPARADCLRADLVRAWSVAGLDRIVVETRGGRFALRLAQPCPELARSDRIRIRAASGGRMVCSGKADRIEPEPAALAPPTLLMAAQAGPEGDRLGVLAAPPNRDPARFACLIAEVERLKE